MTTEGTARAYAPRPIDEGGILPDPTLRQAAIITVFGYLLGLGVGFASFSVLPRLFDTGSAAQTSQNILANQGLFVAAMFAFLLVFLGDVVAAWGLYYLLRRVSASISMLVSGVRVVFATMGLVAVFNLATAHRLLFNPTYLTSLGRNQLDAQVQVAIGAFHTEFSFSLIVFGVHLMMLGWLMFRSGYIPRWLGVVVAISGAGWSVLESGPYLLPGIDLNFLWITAAGELVLLVWLIGWGTRLREPATNRAP
jgi:hypothetical protein